MPKELQLQKVRRQSNRRGELRLRAGVKWLLYSLFALTALLLQTTVLSGLRERIGIAPNLAIAVVVSAALYERTEAAALFGLCLGFFTDCAGNSGMSVMPLVCVAEVILCSALCGLFLNRNFTAWLLLQIAAYAADGLLTLISVTVVWKNFSFLSVLADTVLPNFILSVFVSLLFYFPSRAAARLTARRGGGRLTVKEKG